ncbi:hypothetical protein F4809DRAFT_644285 [Biscogniauxia mediterranea]|nr:hypothetical protein F4809DRAFT_644285 [Biscogniauxia mediterranea]
MEEGNDVPGRSNVLDISFLLEDIQEDIEKMKKAVKEFLRVTCENTFEEHRAKWQAADESGNSVYCQLASLNRIYEGEYPNAIDNHTLEKHDIWGFVNTYLYILAAFEAKAKLLYLPGIQKRLDKRAQYGQMPGGWKCQEDACDCLYCEMGDLPDKETMTAEDVINLDNSAYDQIMRNNLMLLAGLLCQITKASLPPTNAIHSIETSSDYNSDRGGCLWGTLLRVYIAFPAPNLFEALERIITSGLWTIGLVAIEDYTSELAKAPPEAKLRGAIPHPADGAPQPVIFLGGTGNPGNVHLRGMNAEFVAYAVDNIHDIIIIIIITSASSTATTCYSRTHARDSRPHRQVAHVRLLSGATSTTRAERKSIRPGQGLHPHRPLSSAVGRGGRALSSPRPDRAAAAKGLTHSVRSPGVDAESVLRAGRLPRLLGTPTKACLLARAPWIAKEGACAGRLGAWADGWWRTCLPTQANVVAAAWTTLM